MLPINIVANRDRIDYKIKNLDAVVGTADPIIQNVFSNHIVIAGAGFVEHAVLEVIYEYGKVNSNPKISKYLGWSVRQNNSLNCEKISRILNQFDESWWVDIDSVATYQQKLAVDSLKNLRDQIAHGGHNGTGYTTVKNYYIDATKFITVLAGVVLP